MDGSLRPDSPPPGLPGGIGGNCDFYLRCVVYVVFSWRILSPGRVTKKVGKDVVDREFCILFV